MASFVDNFTGKVWDWTKPFQRTSQFPIDRSAIFASYEDAVKYAKGDAANPDSRALYATSYVGQIISVYEDGKVAVYKIEEDRSLAGIGSGALTADNYSAAVALATADNIGQIIYVLNEEPVEGGETYSAGPYIVAGEGVVSKLGTTTATGDLAGDVETLKSDVADLEAALAGKVSTEGYVAYTQEEKVKLADIAEGAQVNVIEKIIFNGSEAVIDTQNKSVTLTTPLDVVRGLADGENVLSLDSESGKLGTTLSLEYYTDEKNVPYIRLRGINGQVGEAINATNFIKDGMLSSVDIVKDPAGQSGTFIEMTFNTDSGITEPMYVDVSDVFTAYVAGDGINIDNNVVKVKVYESDKYLTVDVDGVKTKDIDNAITTAKNAVIGDTDNTAESLTIYGAKKYADSVVANINVKDVDTNPSNGVALSLEEGVVKVSVSTENLGTALVGATGEVGSVSGITVKLGQAITDGAETPTEIISATTSVHAAIQTLAGQIQAAVAGGITGISGDEYITVGGTATAKSLTLNTAKIGTYLVDNASALKVDSTTGKLSLEWEAVE